ncbi:hypothetical protein KCU71_g35, partial [Aureobasidium melanogenum]
MRYSAKATTIPTSSRPAWLRRIFVLTVDIAVGIKKAIATPRIWWLRSSVIFAFTYAVDSFGVGDTKWRKVKEKEKQGEHGSSQLGKVGEGSARLHWAMMFEHLDRAIACASLRNLLLSPRVRHAASKVDAFDAGRTPRKKRRTLIGNVERQAKESQSRNTVIVIATNQSLLDAARICQVSPTSSYARIEAQLDFSDPCTTILNSLRAIWFHLLTYREVSGKSFKYRSNKERQAQINIPLFRDSRISAKLQEKAQIQILGRVGPDQRLHLVMKSDKSGRRPIFCTSHVVMETFRTGRWPEECYNESVIDQDDFVELFVMTSARCVDGISAEVRYVCRKCLSDSLLFVRGKDMRHDIAAVGKTLDACLQAFILVFIR